MDNIKPNVTLFCVFDSCHSGTVLDLKYQYLDSSNYNSFSENEKNLETNGNVINNYNYTTFFPSSYSPESLSFNNLTSEIFGISGSIIVKYNILTGFESFFTLPNIQYIDWIEKIILLVCHFSVVILLSFL